MANNAEQSKNKTIKASYLNDGSNSNLLQIYFVIHFLIIRKKKITTIKIRHQEGVYAKISEGICCKHPYTFYYSPAYHSKINKKYTRLRTVHSFDQRLLNRQRI